MTPPSDRTTAGPILTPRIAVAGAGAAGTLVALHLLRAVARRALGIDGQGADDLEIVLIDHAGPMGGSAAFGTDDERHLLNVPASGMSAWPDDPGHFLAWRNDVLGQATDAYDFVPRRDFARYLRAMLDAAAEASPTVRLQIRRNQAVGATRTAEGVRLTLDDGSGLDTDALVVATGLGTPSAEWAPPVLRASTRFIADPWAPGALDALHASGDRPGDVLVVGAGLTMIDIVLTHHDTGAGRSIHAISRSGALPRRHARRPGPAHRVDTSDWGNRLDAMRERVDEIVRDSLAEHGDWRPAIDGLRPSTASLWARLSEDDRATFLAHDAGAWNRARHRTPRSSTDQLAALAADGRFDLTAARVRAVEPLADGGLRVGLDDGSSHEVSWVVNAAGPRTDVATLGNPLLDNLLEQGLATPATAGMGFWTDDGQLVDHRGTA
ncbi:MAG TPA: FAD/NAD(P)-binding protein, partial [Acidimicrobiales bacterium]|nr:FAD/NAD(P)-binding protein [Acidimicrobiales bacterium]